MNLAYIAQSDHSAQKLEIYHKRNNALRSPGCALRGAPRPGDYRTDRRHHQIVSRKINPAKVFDLTLPLEQVAEGYRARDERRAIKTLLRP